MQSNRKEIQKKFYEKLQRKTFVLTEAGSGVGQEKKKKKTKNKNSQHTKKANTWVFSFICSTIIVTQCMRCWDTHKRHSGWVTDKDMIKIRDYL